jgi:hypothetical protein
VACQSFNTEPAGLYWTAKEQVAATLLAYHHPSSRKVDCIRCWLLKKHDYNWTGNKMTAAQDAAMIQVTVQLAGKLLC